MNNECYVSFARNTNQLFLADQDKQVCYNIKNGEMKLAWTKNNSIQVTTETSSLFASNRWVLLLRACNQQITPPCHHILVFTILHAHSGELASKIEIRIPGSGKEGPIGSPCPHLQLWGDDLLVSYAGPYIYAWRLPDGKALRPMELPEGCSMHQLLLSNNDLALVYLDTKREQYRVGLAISSPQQTGFCSKIYSCLAEAYRYVTKTLQWLWSCICQGGSRS